jgi:hypothetical protein
MAGQLVAVDFKPAEYLAGEMRGATMIEPMTPAHLTRDRRSGAVRSTT